MSEITGLIIFTGIVFVFVTGMWLFTFIFGPKNTSKVKSMPFECGMEPIGPNKTRFPVQYYLYAILLVIFDVEVVFLFPLALIFRENTLLIYVAMSVFLVTAFLGYVYVYKRGGFDFEE
ncbi:MAG: NADH-quinone oxidoreductase subunit A [Deltaproteobacteria bacterium]|nr:NADH-quinone oxidoreductase subunit A [Deltaproteobacteria bacterium]